MATRTETKAAATDLREHTDCAGADESLSRAFDLLGRRWTGPVIGALRSGPAGFREIARLIDGISDSMLSSRLTELTSAGLVTREVCDGPPVGVAYRLTEAGEALIPALTEIGAWAQRYLPRDDG